MSVVLGIDAAWAEKNPSGVAVVASTGDGWRCAGVAPSYEAFVDLASGKSVDWKNGRFGGSKPDVRTFLNAAQTLAGAPVDVVTVDMPMATVPILRRRVADQSTSVRYGACGCAVHNPNPERPGPLGADLSSGFIESGYALAHASEAPGKSMRLVEVYPHPALLVLMRSDYRVPYKVGRSRRYWPGSSPEERIARLLGVFGRMNDALNGKLGPTGLPLPQNDDISTLSALKRYEDALDALICAWVGICYIEGRAVACGDETAAIWCPREQANLGASPRRSIVQAQARSTDGR